MPTLILGEKAKRARLARRKRNQAKAALKASSDAKLDFVRKGHAKRAKKLRAEATKLESSRSK